MFYELIVYFRLHDMVTQGQYLPKFVCKVSLLGSLFPNKYSIRIISGDHNFPSIILFQFIILLETPSVLALTDSIESKIICQMKECEYKGIMIYVVLFDASKKN